VLGLRYLQASLLVPLYRLGNVGCRALPIRFEEVSRVKKPSQSQPGGLERIQKDDQAL
jgi:hypothetical protein